MTKILTILLFGQRAKGEKLPEPKFKSTYPTNRPDENKWASEVKFGNRYGHRGSFYQK